MTGFLPLFAGIMMVAVSNTASENSDKTMKALGPICLTLGVACVLGGFIFQFIKHKLWKSKQQNQEVRNKKYRPSSARSSRPSSASSSSSTSRIARSSIEEPFDDLNEIQETPVTIPEDEVVEFQYNKKRHSNQNNNSNHKKQSKTKDTPTPEMRKVRTIEDELKEMHQQGACASNPLPDSDIMGAEGGAHVHAPLPGSMYNLHDSD